MRKFELVSWGEKEQEYIKAYLSELAEQKNNAVLDGDEEAANSCWRAMEAIELNVAYINAFQNLKDKKFRESWCELEQCEIRASFISNNSSEDFLLHSRVSFIIEVVKKLQSLYPYCVFASPEFTVGYQTCSICGHKVRPRNRCAHVKGKLYCGQLCVYQQHDISLKSISLVSNPVQKYSVVHDDETLNFSALNYLMSIVDNPFELWDTEWTTKAYPAAQFSSCAPDQKCPCDSGSSFSDCCLGKAEIEVPHVNFVFNRPVPEEIPDNIFPY